MNAQQPNGSTPAGQGNWPHPDPHDGAGPSRPVDPMRGPGVGEPQWSGEGGGQGWAPVDPSFGQPHPGHDAGWPAQGNSDATQAWSAEGQNHQGQNHQGQNQPWGQTGQGWSDRPWQQNQAPGFGQNPAGPAPFGNGPQMPGQTGSHQPWADSSRQGVSAGGVAGLLRGADGGLDIGAVALLSALGAQVFVLLGCLGPWVSVLGMSVSGLQGDGVFVLLLTLAAGGVEVACLLGKLAPKLLWVAVGLMALAALIGLIDAGNAGSYMAWGLLFVMFFGIVATAAVTTAAIKRR